jgi:hypothetical protein
MEFKVKLKKLNSYGSDYVKVKIDNVVLEQQLSDLVEYFLSLSFEAREDLLRLLKNK